ncbi:MAG: SDR family oxidoreductase [Rhodospirillales bacterium]|nr:SDR family oxidoreductase [Rhodospirillales bacterium]
MSFKGKNALVTGGRQGIGRACAESLAAEGANVTVVDLLDCNETINAIATAGGMAEQMTCDVTDERAVVAVFEKYSFASNQLDFLVHCAGIIHECPLLETPVSDFDRVIAVNLRGTFLVGREALRCMSRAGSGRVILTSSDLAYYGRETFSAYVASKHGVLGLVRSWAIEFGPSINVNALCPGPTDTAMLDADNMTPEWREKELDIPLRRFGRPEEIARMATFLCGEGGAYITGQGLGVNGGSVMP